MDQVVDIEPRGSKALMIPSEQVSLVEEVEDYEADEDRDRIEQAVIFIKNKVTTSLLNTAIEIGGYLLDNFFHGDIYLAKWRNPLKEVSIAKICRHPDIQLTSSVVSEMIRMAAQEKFFSDNRNHKSLKDISLDNLKYTHRLSLIKIHNDNVKLGFVNQTITKSLKTQQLKKMVRKRKDDLAGKERQTKRKSEEPLKRIRELPQFPTAEDYISSIQSEEKVLHKLGLYSDDAELVLLPQDKFDKIKAGVRTVLHDLNWLRNTYVDRVRAIEKAEVKREKVSRKKSK